jgi:hypothetical protein
MISRRAFVARLAGSVAVGATGGVVLGRLLRPRVATTAITVYKSSTCECCAKWVDHLRANGFAPSVHDEEGMDTVKDNLAIPKDVRSCHTAQIEGYLIEGHVPAADIRRLLAERPKVAGLAVPGMPSRAPGMAEPGDKVGGFGVVAFQSNGGTHTFAQY